MLKILVFRRRVLLSLQNRANYFKIANFLYENSGGDKGPGRFSSCFKRIVTEWHLTVGFEHVEGLIITFVHSSTY